jgi:hypothetical protein
MNEQVHHRSSWETKKQIAHWHLSMGSLLFLVKMVPGTRRMGISLDPYFTTKRGPTARPTKAHIYNYIHIFRLKNLKNMLYWYCHNL